MTRAASGEGGTGPEWRRAAIVALAAALVYSASLVTDVHWGDSAQFARNAARLELSSHARAYPLLRTISWLLGELCGSPACGANLASLVTSALAVGAIFLASRAIGASRAASYGAAATLCFAHTFWSYAVVAEVYGLHALFLAAALALTVGAARGEVRATFWLAIVCGLSLLHHRMMAFSVPVMLVWAAWQMPRDRCRACLRSFVAGAAIGVIPFLAIAGFDVPRTLDGGGTLVGWLKTTFAGGDQHIDFLVAADSKTAPATVRYLAKWLLFNLPGPAAILAVRGAWVGSERVPRVTWLLATLVATNLVFPFRYNWPGDQYAFLAPLYPFLALLAALGITSVAPRFGRRAEIACAVACGAAPVALYTLLGLTSLGPRALPGLRPDVARDFFLVRPDRSVAAGDWCRANLVRVDRDALLAAVWGDGEVYRYLQDVEGLRRDVRVTILSRRKPPGPSSDPLWISVLPIWADPRAQIGFAGEGVEDRGDGLYRLP